MRTWDPNFGVKSLPSRTLLSFFGIGRPLFRALVNKPPRSVDSFLHYDNCLRHAQRLPSAGNSFWNNGNDLRKRTFLSYPRTPRHCEMDSGGGSFINSSLMRRVPFSRQSMEYNFNWSDVIRKGQWGGCLTNSTTISTLVFGVCTICWRPSLTNFARWRRLSLR